MSHDASMSFGTRSSVEIQLKSLRRAWLRVVVCDVRVWLRFGKVLVNGLSLGEDGNYACHEG